MKKTIISTLAMMLAMPVFATPDIASNSNGNGSCVEPVLHRYDGTANLQAGWQANTIQLKWYNGDTQLDVQDAADSCTYDGALTLPSTQPTKTGYTFAGWRVKAAAASGGSCSLTSSDVANAEISWDATHARWKILGSGGYAMLYEFEEENSTGLNNGEWELIDSNGNKYRGTASCNSTTGSSGDTRPSAAMSISNNGQYCWCHAESYTPSGGSSCNVSALDWVFAGDYFDAGGCSSNCVHDCAYYTKNESNFRASVFDVDTASSFVQCTLASLDTSSGIDGGFLYGSTYGYAYNTDRYGLTNYNTWAVEYPHGILKGEAFCSSTDDGKKRMAMQTGNPGTSAGEYCWCRATSYTPTKGRECSSITPSSWMFWDSITDLKSCDYLCVEYCATFFGYEVH